MSWLKSAVHKAVEASGRKNLGRAVKNYADTVVHHANQAVAGGAKIIQDHIGSRNYKSFSYTAKKLEEVVVSCRGGDRIELLRQILLALKGIERLHGNAEEPKTLEQALSLDSPTPSQKNAPLVLFPNSDFVNFRDVFLHSQALEGVTLSMIMEAPNEEEVSLLQEIFELCLTGGKEVHGAILASIKQLARTFSAYHDEVLVKRDELLHFAHSAISGVKLNADVVRIDAEVSDLCKKIDGIEELCTSSDGICRTPTGKTDYKTVEDMKAAIAELKLCSRLEGLLLKKRSINNGDPAETHYEKVDKLKVLAESLANSSSKTEMRILDHRHQLEEALNFRVAKANEVHETEKGLAADIAELEMQRDRLEAELMKVNQSLNSMLLRLNKHREERNHFDEASNQIILHLKSKENELSRSIVSFKVESDIVHEWIKFLEETWAVQSSYAELKEKQTIDELDKCGSCFLKLIKYHLSACQKELRHASDHIKALVDKLKSFNKRLEPTRFANNEYSCESKSKMLLEEEYLEAEGKIVTVFGFVDRMKELFYTGKAHASRRDDTEIAELFDSMEKIRGEFGSLERPKLDLEAAPKEKVASDVKSSSHALRATSTPKRGKYESPRYNIPSDDDQLYPETLSEYGDASGDWSNEDNLGWELD